MGLYEQGQNGNVYDAGYTPGDDEIFAGWFSLLGLTDDGPDIWRDLSALVMKSSSEDVLALEDAFETGVLPKNLTHNRAAQALVQSQNREVLDYLVFTRELDESGCFGGGWDYYVAERGSVSRDDERIERAYNFYAHFIDKNNELALRYAYQYMRLLFYSGRHTELIEFFEEDIYILPDNPVKEWCRMFYGGSLYAMDNYADAFAAYAIVFHRSSRYNFRSFESIKWLYNDFRYAFHGDYQTMVSEKFPDNYDARRELWAVYDAELDKARAEFFSRGYVKPLSADEDALVRSTLAYLHGNTEESLVSVLAMVANGGAAPANLEDFLAKNIGQLGYESFTHYQSHTPDSLDMERLIVKVASKRPSPALWQLAAAQLAIMRYDNNTAQKYIDMAVKSGAEQEIPGQLLVTRILLEAWLGKLDAESEARLGAMLEKLGNSYDDKSYGTESYALHNAWVGILDTVLNTRYKDLGREDRVFLCLAVLNDHLEWRGSEEFFSMYRSYYSFWEYGNFGAILQDTDILAKIIAVMQNPQGSLEKYFIANLETWNTNVLYELQGINFALRHDFANAANAFNGITEHKLADFVFQPAGTVSIALETALNMAAVSAARPESTDAEYFEYSSGEWSWANQRFYDKTKLLNLITDSDNTIYGWRWDGDDYAGLYEAAADAGLNERSAALLRYLTQSPRDFKEFADKMLLLQELSDRTDELGAMAAYFYALGVYNMQIQGRLHQLEFEWPKSEVAYILEHLAKAETNSSNNELKARANFISAGVIKHAQFTRNGNYSWYYNEPEWDEDEFRPYYEALWRYKDTLFGETVLFNCTFASDFLY